MADPASAPTSLDGRRARRERGRRAVVDAMIELVAAGHLPPAADEVAERAGVSVASLFRYFDGLDELQQEATARFFARYAEAFEIPRLGAGPLDARVEAFVRARVALYETIEPFARLARARSLDHPHLAVTLSAMRVRLAGQIRVHFAAELDRCTPAAADDLVGLLATMTSFESWDQLRAELDRSPRQIRRAWTTAVLALLAADRAA